MSGLLGIRVEPGRIKDSSWRDYACRFAFGGAITLMTGIIANAFGPGVGGLFLAFPAILPATLTLLEKHTDNCKPAGADAVGASVGGLGMLAFAGVVAWVSAAHQPAWAALSLATLAWLASSLLLWGGLELLRRWRKRRRAPARRRARPAYG